MAAVETSFGQPNLLLGEPFTLEGNTPNHEPAGLAEESMHDGFCFNGLLGDALLAGGPVAAILEKMSRKEVQGETLSAVSSESEQRFTLNDDAFSLNGLLSDSVIQADLSIQPSTFLDTNTSQSQSQDDEFPEISDLLKSYAAKSLGDSNSTASTISSVTSLPPHLSRLSVRATTFDGTLVFLRKKPRKFASKAADYGSRGNIANLLDVPLHRLLEDLAKKNASKLAEQPTRPESQECTASQDSSLWVDRYRPKKFTDLLGDDRVHREVMSWVKEWDYCVFGKKKGKKRARDDDNPDEYRRPQEKLLLISGPPGLGKTTLAHVVARQAGYSVYEINASDARSAQVVDERIRPALESGSRVGGSKPTLVVVDEIDGATGGGEHSSGFIYKLIQLTQDRTKKKAKKGEAQANRPLLRPIICICNDLYASSLTKLQPHAFLRM